MARTMEYCKWRNSLADLRHIERRLADTFSPDDIGCCDERKAYDQLRDLLISLADKYA